MSFSTRPMSTGSSCMTWSRSIGLVFGLLHTSSTFETVVGRLGIPPTYSRTRRALSLSAIVLLPPHDLDELRHARRNRDARYLGRSPVGRDRHLRRILGNGLAEVYLGHRRATLSRAPV